MKSDRVPRAVDEAQAAFERAFGRMAERTATAPGRVNLIGEHTDYNGGYVLPMAIPQRTVACVAARTDERVRVTSREAPRGEDVREFRLGEEERGKGWVDYVQAITYVVRRSGHHSISGFDLHLASDVPVGAGLSSSAALSVSLLRALRDLFGLACNDVEIAKLGQRAENEFVGAPVGIMDPMACSLADERTALFIDTRSLEHSRVPLPDALEIAVIDSGITHSHAHGDYRTRRSECERAAEKLGVPQLRDVSIEDLRKVDALPDPLRKRARHVVTEDQRVLDAVAALRREDGEALGRLFYESHKSMRDDFAVSLPEIDLIVDLARGERGVVGARLTGGGFGGSVVLLAEAGRARDAALAVAGEYDKRTGQHAKVLVPAPPEADATEEVRV